MDHMGLSAAPIRNETTPIEDVGSAVVALLSSLLGEVTVSHGGVARGSTGASSELRFYFSHQLLSIATPVPRIHHSLTVLSMDEDQVAYSRRSLRLSLAMFGGQVGPGELPDDLTVHLDLELTISEGTARVPTTLRLIRCNCCHLSSLLPASPVKRGVSLARMGHFSATFELNGDVWIIIGGGRRFASASLPTSLCSDVVVYNPVKGAVVVILVPGLNKMLRDAFRMDAIPIGNGHAESGVFRFCIRAQPTTKNASPVSVACLVLKATAPLLGREVLFSSCCLQPLDVDGESHPLVPSPQRCSTSHTESTPLLTDRNNDNSTQHSIAPSLWFQCVDIWLKVGSFIDRVSDLASAATVSSASSAALRYSEPHSELIWKRCLAASLSSSVYVVEAANLSALIATYRAKKFTAEAAHRIQFRNSDWRAVTVTNKQSKQTVTHHMTLRIPTTNAVVLHQRGSTPLVCIALASSGGTHPDALQAVPLPVGGFAPSLVCVGLMRDTNCILLAALNPKCGAVFVFDIDPVRSSLDELSESCNKVVVCPSQSQRNVCDIAIMNSGELLTLCSDGSLCVWSLDFRCGLTAPQGVVVLRTQHHRAMGLHWFLRSSTGNCVIDLPCTSASSLVSSRYVLTASSGELIMQSIEGSVQPMNLHVLFRSVGGLLNWKQFEVVSSHGSDLQMEKQCVLGSREVGSRGTVVVPPVMVVKGSNKLVVVDIQLRTVVATFAVDEVSLALRAFLFQGSSQPLFHSTHLAFGPHCPAHCGVVHPMLRRLLVFASCHTKGADAPLRSLVSVGFVFVGPSLGIVKVAAEGALRVPEDCLVLAEISKLLNSFVVLCEKSVGIVSVEANGNLTPQRWLVFHARLFVEPFVSCEIVLRNTPDDGAFFLVIFSGGHHVYYYPLFSARKVCELTSGRGSKGNEGAVVSSPFKGPKVQLRHTALKPRTAGKLAPC